MFFFVIERLWVLPWGCIYKTCVHECQLRMVHIVHYFKCLASLWWEHSNPHLVGRCATRCGHLQSSLWCINTRTSPICCECPAVWSVWILRPLWGSLNFIPSPFADSPRADTTSISTFWYLMWILQSSPFRLSICWNCWWHGLTVQVYGKQEGRCGKLLVPDTCPSQDESKENKVAVSDGCH